MRVLNHFNNYKPFNMMEKRIGMSQYRDDAEKVGKGCHRRPAMM